MVRSNHIDPWIFIFAIIGGALSLFADEISKTLSGSSNIYLIIGLIFLAIAIGISISKLFE